MNDQHHPPLGVAVDRDVGRDDWKHLRWYGYAPGDYISDCHFCKQQFTDADKRAVTCRPCAEWMYAASEEADHQVEAQGGAHGRPPMAPC